MDTPAPDPDHAFADFLRKPRYELIAVCLALLLGILLRTHYAPNGGFDREFDGAQGSFFGFSSINYERVGFAPTGGYPVVNLDTIVEDKDTWFVYGNHSPFLAWGEWASLKLLGPDGWETAWQEGRSPSGLGTDHSFEFALRLPMFMASIFSLLALWWAIRIEGGKRNALFALLLYGIAPLAVLQAGIVNYEPASILFVLLAYGFFSKLRVRDRECAERGEAPALFPKELLLTCLMIAIGTSQTFAPLFFAVPLCIAVLLSRLRAFGAKRAFASACAVGLSALAPILIHGFYVRGALAEIQPMDQVSDRIAVMFRPLLSGDVPFFAWVGLQYKHFVMYGSEILVDLTGVGLIFALFILADRWTRSSSDQAEPKALPSANPAALPALLAAGGFTVLFGFYVHTSDDPAQSSFILNVLPAAAALGALALVQMGDAVGRAFARSGKRWAGAVLATVFFLLTANGARATTNFLWGAWRGPEPSITTPEIAGAALGEILPPGSVGVFPDSMSYTTAVSFYAWRTLLPVKPNPLSVQWVETHLIKWGLVGRPRYLLLPDNPPAHAKAGVDATLAFFQANVPKIAAQEPIHKNGWRAWRLDVVIED
ncbi:MAG: hypothetical protein ACJAZ8_002817 [Planctomycetota bacterium]